MYIRLKACYFDEALQITAHMLPVVDGSGCFAGVGGFGWVVTDTPETCGVL